MVISGIALTSAGTYWSTVVRREKEAELLFRGDQIYHAIESFYKSAPGGSSPRYPASLKELLKDPRYPEVRRHLRRPYKDPMTPEGKWGLVLDAKGRVKGVYSLSGEKPMKVSGFLPQYASFERAKRYSDWRFVYEPKQGKKTPKK